MRRILKYEKFFEDIAISPNDSPVSKMAKQEVNADNDYLEDYKAKKDKLTEIFLSTDANAEFNYDDKMLQVELEKLLGKEEKSAGADRNPLLQELTKVLDLQRQVASLEKKNLSDKKRLDEVGDEQADEEGPRKEELGKRMSDITANVTENTGKIADLSKKIADSKKAFDTKIAEFMKNVQKSSDDIKNTPPK